MNNEKTENKPDPLDKLLNTAPLAQPSSWFEAKVMARVAREKEQKASKWKVLISMQWLRLGVPSLAAVALVAVVSLNFVEKPVQDSVQLADFMSDEEVFLALEAFESYSEETEIWSDLL